ncbi:MAG: CHASE2 domain-containing protein [Cyanobacteria bacterium J06621_11]
MPKRVTLKLNNGSLLTGFSVILQMGEEGAVPTIELAARLPAAPAVNANYQRWRRIYWQQSQIRPLARIEADRTGFATNVSFIEDCSDLSEQLKVSFNKWLRTEPFRPVREKLLERLDASQPIQLIVQTDDSTVKRLPWQLWEMCDRFPTLEIALSAPAYEVTTAPIAPQHDKVRILAVLGNSKGLDTQTDQTLLSDLPNAEIQYLRSPDRPSLNEALWDAQGWDILFFAGHSATQTAKQGRKDGVGKLYINPTDSITVSELKHALSKAVTRGLKIAIFNSCDGLGLAQSLADLHLSQTLVMRELVPDPVAHAFLKSFLSAFSRGEPLYLAVREAREKLHGLESQFPCASWLPIIYQNPAERSPQWHTLYRVSDRISDSSSSDSLPTPHASLSPAVAPSTHPKSGLSTPFTLLTHALIALALIGLQSLGLFQSAELKVFDLLMRLRPLEGPDPRLLVVTVTEADVQAQPAEERNGSLGDRSLSQALEQLEPMAPRMIGLDIYRDFAVRADQPELAARLANTDNLLLVCKSSNTSQEDPGIAPPPEVPDNRIGFSDFVDDSDSVIRRQLLSMTPEASSPCQSAYSLSSLLALSYLSQDGVDLQPTETGELQLGEVTITPLNAHEGGYRNVDDWGYQLLLNYRSLNNPEDIAERVTLADLLAGKVSAEAVRDRIVMIGTTDSSFKDYWLTPYSRSAVAQEQTYGVFMQAQMVSHLLSAVLDGRPLLKSWSEPGEWLWIVGWTGVGSLIVFGLGRRYDSFHRSVAVGRWLLALLAAEVGLLCLGWILLTKMSYWVPTVPSAIAPIAVLASAKAGAQTNTQTSETAGRKVLKSADKT